MKYNFTKKMGEISGLGGSYEQTCRDMLKIALDWNDNHPNTNPIFKTYENIYGIATAQNNDANNLEKAISDNIEDYTGAMFQAIIQTFFYIKQNGWKQYKKEMSKKKELGK